MIEVEVQQKSVIAVQGTTATSAQQADLGCVEKNWEMTTSHGTCFILTDIACYYHDFKRAFERGASLLAM